MRPPSGRMTACGRSLVPQRMDVTARASFVPAPYTMTSCPFVVHSLTRPSGVTMRLGIPRRSSHARAVKRDGEAQYAAPTEAGRSRESYSVALSTNAPVSAFTTRSLTTPPAAPYSSVRVSAPVRRAVSRRFPSYARVVWATPPA